MAENDSPIEEKLTAKAGPFPVWVWGVVLGLLILAMVWWSRHKSGSAAPADGSTVTPIDALPNVSGSGLSPASGDTSTGSDSAAGSPWDTNQLWEARAIAALSGAGVSPLTAQVALEKYLNGQGLTTAEQQIINSVLQKQGAPPNGLTSAPVLLPPDNPPPSGGGTTGVPPHGGKYRIVAGDNWNTIASKFGVTVADLLATNANDPSRGQALAVGDYIWLPQGISSPSVSSPKPSPTKTVRVTIKAGDNWNTIAARLGVTEPALRGANPSLPGALHTGSYLFNVPGK